MRPFPLPPCLVIAALVATSAFPASTPITPVPAFAASRVATVQVRVTPDHADWTYEPGERARFRVTVTADNEPVEGATISYAIGPEMMPVETRTATVPADGLVLEGGTMNVPGFLRCTVTTEVLGKTWRGLATVGFSPEKIVATQTAPEDFDAFWQAGKEALAQVPMEARMTLLPEACTSDVDVYHVSFRILGANWGPPARFFGIYCEPKAPGKYPAILKVPGAGVRPYSGDVGLAARGALVLEVGIHGIPVNMERSVYEAIAGGALRGYWNFNNDDRENYYYRRVYLGCVRANDFLTSRDNWNREDLLVMGASQGGQLSIVTAALDDRITALAATHPAGCDWTGYLHGRAGGWPHPFKPNDDGSPSVHTTPAKMETLRYYDVVNFARRLKVPGHYIWGYNDETCPPTSMFAAYNAITAPKELHLLLEVGHSYPAEQWEAINRWVGTTLGLK
jgi:cephalosporin-C deacetylase-like acetyl esterase